jgi:pimeloyl-ACP methyl ester carboxylesterase
MRSCLPLNFLPLVLVAATGIADEQETHIWTSADGKHSVEASLVGSEYDRELRTTLFTLQKKDGNVVIVPADRLSEGSRQRAVRILRQRRSAAGREERRSRHEAAQDEQAKRRFEIGRIHGFAGEAGMILPKQMPHGSYLQYIPRRPPLGIIVVVHGTPGENERALDVAHKFIRGWVALAEQKRAIVLAPAFDQDNFGGREGPGGGYRGLFGRKIGADEFVNQIVEQYRVLFPSSNGKFMLYGHSAGGQFVSRYLVKHPDRIIAAVISAAGTFAFPNPNWPWTDGMARLTRKIRWGPTDAESPFDFQPDPRGWLKAATLPVTVVVGSQDVEASKPSPSQKGNNHVERAQHWVEDMNALARREGRMGNVQLVIVPGVGHSSSRLRPVCQTALWRK